MGKHTKRRTRPVKGFPNAPHFDGMARGKRAHVANAVRDCAEKVSAWPTTHLPADHAAIVQRELGRIGDWLRLRCLAIRHGQAGGVYDE